MLGIYPERITGRSDIALQPAACRGVRQCTLLQKLSPEISSVDPSEKPYRTLHAYTARQDTPWCPERERNRQCEGGLSGQSCS